MVLPAMPDGIRRRGFDLARRFFNGDKAYGSDENCERLFWMGMIPNIRQRKDAVSRGKPTGRRRPGCSTTTSTERDPW